MERQIRHCRAVFGVIVSLCLLPLTVPAGSTDDNDEEWKAVPQVDSISFGSNMIGLTAPPDRYFTVFIDSGLIQENGKAEWQRTFAGHVGPKALYRSRREGPATLSTSISGKDFELDAKDAYCSEGDNTKHILRRNGVDLKNHVDGCDSISAAEVIDDELWLGTRVDGEYGDDPADGIVVQSLKTGRLLARLNRARGLTGDLIRVIRWNRAEEMIWVATNRGLNAIDRQRQIKKSWFFFEDLDADTGLPTIRLTPSWQKSNRAVQFFRDLAVADARKFHEALTQVPSDVLERIMTGDLAGGNFTPKPNATVANLAPTSANALVPFFIAAARSSNESARLFAIAGICAFNDARVVDFLRTDVQTLPNYRLLHPASVEKQCWAQYQNLGLVQ